MVPGEFERERKIFNKKGVLLDKITINNLNKLLKKKKLNFFLDFYEKHRILAITLARGGSKSIRKKYLQD